ncbi:MFS transporter [Candidatus Bathyarchaeota archaeon]|nr:MFS transporter [Candidatus Bathyarchaeota archaeon]
MLTKASYQRILRLGFPFEVLNKDLRLIFTSNLTGAFGDGLYAYLLPYYMTKTLNASAVEVGILYAIVSLVAASTLFIAGMFADEYDRKKIMIAGWIAWIPAPLIFSFAENWLQMLPGMILWGFWFGGPTTTAYVVTTADKKQLTLTFTVVSSAWSVGYIFSPALGGYLAEIVGMRFVFYLAFVLYTLAALILIFIQSQKAEDFKQDSSKEQYSLLKLLKTRELLKYSAFFASIFFVVIMFRPFVPKFLGDIYHYGDFEIGILGSISFFGSAALGILLGKLGDRWKKSYALSVSMALCSFTLILLLLFNNFPILIFTFFLMGGSYITWSLMSAIIGPSAPESIRARWVSIPQTISMFSSFIAPYLGGILYYISPQYLFITAIIATAIMTFLASLAES